MTTKSGLVPSTALDPFTPDALANPYPVYRELRDLGPVVYLGAHSVWLITRYDDVRAALTDWETFTSSRGVAMTAEMSEFMVGTPLGTDPPEHDQLRAVLSDKLVPRALAKLRTEVRRRADELVAEVVARREFDAMSDLCQRFPVSVVADLVGLPQQGREILLPGAEAMFATFGPMDERLQARMPDIQRFVEFMNTVTTREHLAEGSWGAAILDAVNEGRIKPESAVPLMSAYLIAGMDTTTYAIGAYVQVLAERPDVWAALKADPSRVAAGFEEVLRFHPVANYAIRLATRDVEVAGATIPAGARVLLGLGSADRDERHYPDPDCFDLDRNPLDHLSFGNAVHACAGQGLARIEAAALITALLDRVDHLELAGPAVPMTRVPGIHGFDRLPVVVTPTEEV